MIFDKMYTTIDTHTAGEPLRIITSGVPEIKGETQLEKRAYCMEHLDGLRQLLMYEPRGHSGMYACIITEPSTPEADFGVLFMHNEGWSTMCGHGVIGVVTMVIETGMVKAGSNYHKFVVDCPCGPITAYATIEGQVVTSVGFENVPSFVYKEDFPIVLENHQFNVDISYGGAFYAIVDAKELSLELTKENLDELKNWGYKIKNHIEAQMEIRHPYEDIEGIYGVIFSDEPKNARVDLRNVTIFADKQIDRSPCGSGTAARVAALYSRGEWGENEIFKHEGITDEYFIGEVISTQTLGDFNAIIPKITGSAFITGFHQFVINPDDTLKKGFLI